MTEKQKMFADEYLVDLNATQAAIRAGYSPKSAKEQGAKLLTKTNIRAYVDGEIAKRSRRTGINQDRVVRELARLAFVNATDVVDAASARLLEGASRDDTAAIASVKVKSGEDFTEREIKMADKLKALELLGRHLGMFQDKARITLEVPVIFEGEDRLED